MPEVDTGPELKDKEENAPADPEELESLYRQPSPENIPDEEKIEPRWRNKFYNRFLGTNRKKGILGGGLIGLIALIIFGTSILQGPFQFIHLAQLLQRFHFQSQNDQGNDRFGKLARFIRTGDVKQTRMGYLGARYAASIDTRMSEAGIKTMYTEKYGYLDGYLIDNTAEKSPYKDMTNEEIKKDLIGKGLKASDISITDGKVSVNAKEMGYFQKKSLIKIMVKTSGVSDIPSSINARILRRYAGVSFHVMTPLDQKANEKLLDYYDKLKKKLNAQIKDGADAAKIDNAPDEQKKAEDAKNSTNGGNKAAPDEYKTGAKASIAAKGIAAVALVCAINQMDQDIGKIKYVQVVVPLIRMAMETITIGNQVMNGNQVDVNQLGFYVQQLSSKTDGSWSTAQSIQAEIGQKQTGTGPDETLKNIGAGSPFAFIEAVPGLSVLCSQVAQWLLLGISAVLGPFSTALGIIVSQYLLTPFMDEATHWLAGEAVNPNVQGAVFGNYVNYGSRLAANAQAVTEGGRKLSGTEESQLNKGVQQASTEDFMTHNIAYRLFNLKDQRSAVSKLVDQQDPNPAQNATRLATTALSFGSLFSSITKIFSSTVHADSLGNYDYGFPMYGFSPAEMNASELENPFDNANNVAKLLNAETDPKQPSGTNFIGKAKSCFDVTLSKDSSGLWDAQSNFNEMGINVYDHKNYDPLRCDEGSQDWLKVRMFIFDTKIMKSYACFDGDDQSCSDLGYSPDTSGVSVSTTNASGPVANGTNAQLAQKILDYQKTGQYHCDNPGDCVDLQKTASGQSVKHEVDRNSAWCSTDSLDPQVLKLILYVIEVGKFKVGTFALCGDHHDDGQGGHSGGHAVDFSSVNGVSIDSSGQDAQSNTMALAQFLHNLIGSPLAVDQLITDGYGGNHYQPLTNLEIYNGQACYPPNTNCYPKDNPDHRDHIHAGY